MLTNTGSLKNKTSLIIGGSRGIGRAIALELGRRGADVSINYLRHDSDAKSVQTKLKRLGRKTLLLKGNIGNDKDAEEVFQVHREHFGRIDILVHCAALSIFSPLIDLPLLQCNRIVNLNCLSFVNCVQKALKMMKRGSSIVAVSSLGSARFVTNYGALGIAKAGLESAIRYLSVELAPKGIRVNAVSGGPVFTPGVTHFPNYARRRETAIRKTPYQRLGRPGDIAKIAVFLCEPNSSWLCGQIVVADGGLSLPLL